MSQHYRCGIIHFNDVYHVSAGNHEPVGGASRFTSAVRSSLEALQQQGYNDSFVLFSGDAFSPSTESSITRGKHMPAVLNELGIHAACVGNHGKYLDLSHSA
ncbi:hypothetical protein NQZ79_g1799 [Umbelopsis isabellina]|nr:hypothetical protein NQZ79_g1799 [Umbelopsis isabellina]